MVEKLIQALKNKYANLGLGQDQLSGVASILALSVNSDEGIEKAVAAAEPLCKSMQSENDKQRTAAAKAAQELKELQEKIKQFENKQNPPKPDPKKDEPEVPEYIKQMMETMKTLSSDVASIKGEKITNDRKAQISTLTQELPDGIKAVYNRMDYSKYDEAQFAELKEIVKAETERIKSEISQRGFNPPFAHNQLDGNPKKATKEEIKAVMDLMPKR